MAIQFQLRRGTTVQNNAFVGAEGEITVDTEKHAIRIHDGVTPGGYTQDFVTETWISDDGLSWYRKYASGWVEQGGETEKNLATANIVLPIAMLNDTYNIFCCTKKYGSSGGGGIANACGVAGITTTGFQIDMPQNSIYSSLWQVSGLGAQ